jgi:hypothetical protein
MENRVPLLKPSWLRVHQVLQRAPGKGTERCLMTDVPIWDTDPASSGSIGFARQIYLGPYGVTGGVEHGYADFAAVGLTERGTNHTLIVGVVPPKEYSGKVDFVGAFLVERLNKDGDPGIFGLEKGPNACLRQKPPTNCRSQLVS